MSPRDLAGEVPRQRSVSVVIHGTVPQPPPEVPVRVTVDGTIDVGFVHVGKPVSQRAIEGVWECADDCPHPDHKARGDGPRDIEAPSQPGSDARGVGS